MTTSSQPPLAVILTAGSGTRLQPLTPATPKPFVPLLNRPLLAYTFDVCRDLALPEVVVVIGGGQEHLADAVAALAPPGLRVTTAVQAQPRGPGDAVASVGEALSGRTVVVFVVDALIRGSLRPALDAFLRSDAVAALPLHPTDRPREMGIAVIEGDRIVHLEEKPQQPRSNLAVIGVWMLSPRAVERVRTNPVINAKGESDLTATVAALLNEGGKLLGWRIEGEWLDAGALGALLTAQQWLLRDLQPTALDASGCEVSGAVAAGAGAQVVRSTIEGPVLIGTGAVVEDCVLGPNVVVGDGAQLSGVRLRDALVQHGARVEGLEDRGVVVTTAGAIGRPA